MVVYNEINPYAAEWLRNLGAAGLIEPGPIYETDVQALGNAIVPQVAAMDSVGIEPEF